jgi:hypothetical protein
MTKINLAPIAERLDMKNIAFSAPKNTRVGDAPILDNGLNLLYAPQGYGKSYTAILIAKQTKLPTVYFDMESNGSNFVTYCQKNHIEYVYVGDTDDSLSTIKDLTLEIKKEHGKAFIIIDSYSDLFPSDELMMPTVTQKALGSLNKFFMRVAQMPVLLLDHATESEGGYKIEGNKSGKFKKTLAVLRLDKIGGNIENGTFITVERSRDHDALELSHRENYLRNNYLEDKLFNLIKTGKLQEKFTAKDLEKCISGDDRALWRSIQKEIATSHKEGRKTIWTLKRDFDI